MNVRVPICDTRDRKKAYGLAIPLQNDIINKMTETIENLRVKGKTFLLPFQKGTMQFLYTQEKDNYLGTYMY